MSKKRRRYEGCTICEAKPAPYRLMEKGRGGNIINKGRVCELCMKAWLAAQQKEAERVSTLLPISSEKAEAGVGEAVVPDATARGVSKYGARPAHDGGAGNRQQSNFGRFA